MADSEGVDTVTPPARAALVAAVAATVALAGCSGISSGPAQPGAQPASAAMGFAAQQSAPPFLARLEAAAAEQGTVEVTFSGDTVDGSGYVLPGSDPAGNYVLNMGDTNTQLVVVDGVAYFKDGGVLSGRWTSMPAKGFAITQAFTPQGVFAAMRAGATSVEDLGPDDLYGTPTRLYELVVRSSGARPASAVRPALLATSDHPDTVYSVWVGEGDLTRRVEVLTQGGSLVLEYGRWGESMEVVAPPADLVNQAAGG
jgi:hypothetical protein